MFQFDESLQAFWLDLETQPFPIVMQDVYGTDNTDIIVPLAPCIYCMTDYTLVRKQIGGMPTSLPYQSAASFMNKTKKQMAFENQANLKFDDQQRKNAPIRVWGKLGWPNMIERGPLGLTIECEYWWNAAGHSSMPLLGERKTNFPVKIKEILELTTNKEVTTLLLESVASLAGLI